MAKLRFAQAGVSMIHANMYRDTLMLFPDDIELVGFYDPDPDSVRSKLKPNVENVPFYPSIEALIEQARPDAILVSALPVDMPKWALPVVEAGVHLWLEKPFAAHSSQLAPVAAAIERNGLQFSCGYSWRFHPVGNVIKDAYDAGLLGKPYSIEMRFLTSSVMRRGPTHWGFQRELSGGGILNWLGCHWFDLMRYLTGAEVTRVAAIEATVSGEPIDVEDAAAVSLQFDNGMIGSLHAGFFTPGDGETSIGLRGSKGWAKWEVDSNGCKIKSIDPAWAAAPVRTYDIPTAQIPGYGPEGLVMFRAFIDAIRGQGSSGFTIHDAIKSLEIIEAAHEAARTCQTVNLEHHQKAPA